MKRSYRLYRIVGDMLILIIFATVLVACAGDGIVRPVKLYQDLNGKQIKSAYVVKQDKSHRDIELHVQKALTENGILSSVGPLTSKSDTDDIYIIVFDRWSWDMAMYLAYLEISFYENSSGSLLATGKYEMVGFHGYPDPEKVTKDVVQSILTKMNFKNLSSSARQR